MGLYLTYVFILLNIVGLNGQFAGPTRRNPGPQQQQTTAAANFAVNTLNQQNRQKGGTRWYALTTIQTSNTQSTNGLIHTIDMILTESMCPNTNNYQGATQAQCQPYNGGAVMRCSVTVWQQPMALNFRLQNSNCSPVNPASNQIGTAKTGNTVNNQQVSPSASTNSPQGLRDAANFATNQLNSQNRQQARTRKWYTLMDVRNPGQQTTNSMVYNMDIVLSESGCPNTVAFINASPSRCPPVPGSGSQLCSVVVTYNPTRLGYRLTNYNCQQYQQQQQGNAQGSVGTQGRVTSGTQASTVISSPSFATSGQPNTGSPTTVNVQNLRNNQQQITQNRVVTQTGQPNLRPLVNQPLHNLFQSQQPSGVALTNTGTRVNPGFPRPTTRLNVGATNPTGSINQISIGSQGPQTNLPRNIFSGVNNVRQNGLTNPDGSMNLSGIGSRVPQTNRLTNPGSSINLSGIGSQGPQTNLQQNLFSGVNNVRQNGLTNPDGSINFSGIGSRVPQRNGPTNPGSSINLSGIGSQGPQTNLQQNLFSGVNNVRQNGLTNPDGSINLSGIGSRVPQRNGPTNLGSSLNLSGSGSRLPQTNGPTNPGSSLNLSGIGPRAPQTNGPTNPGSSINLGGIGSRVPQTNGPTNPGSSINLSGLGSRVPQTNGPTNPGSSINLSGIGSRVPQTNLPQNQNFRIGSSVQTSGQGQVAVPGQRQTASLTGQQTQFTQRGQQTNNAGLTSAAGVPLQQSNQIDSQVTAAANFAANSYNEQIRQLFSTEDKRYSLIDISNVQRQGNGGSVINMDINLQQSSCLNTAVSTGATVHHCPPIPGGKIKLCSVSVVYDTTRRGFRLLSSTCRDPRPQQMSTGSVQSTVLSSTTSQQNSLATQTSGAAGATTTSIDSTQKNSQIRKAANTATNEINIQTRQNNANDNKWYKLVEIQDPQIQNVGGSIIGMNLVLAQSNCLNVAANLGASNSRCPASPGGLTKMCSVQMWHESFNVEDKLLSFSCQQTQTSVVQGPTVQQQTQQQSMSTSGLRPAQTASSIIPGAVLNNQVKSSPSQVGGGQLRTGFSPAASLTGASGVQTGSSAVGAALTQTGANINIGIPPSMNTKSGTAQLGLNSQVTAQGSVSTGANTGGINGAGAGSSQGSPRVIDVANFATNEVNTRSKPTEPSWFTLVDITNATRQELISGGWIYKMEIVLAESTCQNIETNFDANNLQCPEINGGRVRLCRSEVMNEPNIPGLQLMALDCMLDTPTQTGPNNILPTGPLQQQVPAGTNTGLPQVTANTPEIMDAARFAAHEINMQIRQDPNIIDPKWFTLASFRNTQQTFLGGMVYSMEIDLVESTCQNIDQYINATSTQCPPQNKASTKTCYIEVERVPILLSYKLKTQHCSTHAFSSNTTLFTKPTTHALANQTQDIKAAANFAVNKINEQNRKPNSYRYVLVNIHNPREKSFSGWEYRMNLMLQKSTCLNTPANNDATEQQCPPQTGGPLRICEVKVFNQPWTFGYRLENAHCLKQ